MTTSTEFVIASGLAELVEASGANSRDHGFHDDWPKPPISDASVAGSQRAAERYSADTRRAIAEKLALIHEEISEALGEIRSDRDPLEIYFVDHKGLIGPKGQEYGNQAYGTFVAGQVGAFRFGTPQDGDVPLLKPEGFLVELADAGIRIGDLVYLVKGSDRFVDAREIKHEYNATRPYKHGGKF